MQLKKILPITTLVFLGYLGFSITFPLFPPLFLDPESTFFSGQLSPEQRNIFLGVLLSMYPLGQLVGCPLIGKLSDHFGRKRILLYSLAAIIPTYIGSAIAVHYSLVPLLFLARFLGGIFEGNVTIAQASLADISGSEKEKRKGFGISLSMGSLGWVLGPYMGGKLSDSNLVSWFNYSTPFWAAAIISLLALFYIWRSFPVTPIKRAQEKLKISSVFFSLFKGFKIPHLRRILGVNTLLYMAIFFFFSFLPVFLVQKYGYDASSLAEIIAYNSIPIALAPLLQARLFKNMAIPKVMAFASFLLSAGMLFLLVPKSPYALLFTLIPPSFAIAWGLTHGALMVSENTEPEFQGEALGLNQSMQVFSEALSAIIGGQLAGLVMGLPLMVGAGFAALAGIFAMLTRLTRQSDQ